MFEGTLMLTIVAAYTSDETTIILWELSTKKGIALDTTHYGQTIAEVWIKEANDRYFKLKIFSGILLPTRRDLEKGRCSLN